MCQHIYKDEILVDVFFIKGSDTYREIVERRIIVEKNGERGRAYYPTHGRNNFYRNEWFETYEEAQAEAIRMRDRDIERCKEQIKKLRAMKFRKPKN